MAGPKIALRFLCLSVNFVCLSVCPHLSYYVFSVTHRSFRPGILVCGSL